MGRGRMSDLDKIWDQCAAHLRPALAFARDLHRVEDVRQAVEASEAQLWPLKEHGSIVTEMRDFPTGVRVLDFWLAGGSLGALVAAEPEIAKWGREHGCDAARIIGRLGWAKALPHYERGGVV